MNRPTLAVTLLCISVSANAVNLGNVFGGLMGRSGSLGQDTNVDDTLRKVSVHMNRKVPMMIDKDTQLDRVSVEPGRKLIYHYTLTATRSTDIKPADFRKMITPPLRERLCGSTEMLGFLNSGVRVAYMYKGNDGRPIGGTEFAANECVAQT